MTATLIARAKEVRDDGSIVEVVIWQLQDPLPLSAHPYKYRLYYGASGRCRVRYDNERDKGDHRHMGEREESYEFVTVDKLLDDFRHDVDNWR
jgi:hypothetical protein